MAPRAAPSASRGRARVPPAPRTSSAALRAPTETPTQAPEDKKKSSSQQNAGDESDHESDSSQPTTAEYDSDSDSDSLQQVTAAPTTTAINELLLAPEFVHGTLPPPNRYQAGHLPPMTTLEEIFTDLTQKALSLGLLDVLKRLNGRPLRVATVCSGTESPLLAIEMIQKGLGTEGQRFRIEHLFSCEIVPFKQAYIERNFGPPLLFRDICELGGKKAQTAYGSEELIPTDPDVLIAGTACVDFSMLNNNKAAQKESGESSSTFGALLKYAERYRPRLVICENVKMAPWKAFTDAWSKVGYSAAEIIVDTKQYYIPHTRERGYVIAIDNRRLEMPDTDRSATLSFAMDLVTKFSRPCSSPTSSFLLGEDDRRLEQVLKDLSTRLETTSARAEISWEAYKRRHDELRQSLPAGDQRPISRSVAGGVTCTGPDFYWRQWFGTQVERVWETLDIKFQVGLDNGYDFNYKERYIDLSQGVDRGTDGPRFGVTNCLTPCGVQFSTIRGGPLTGLEALSLQGLPLDRLILSNESTRELQDLAGNAMTTTTVGAVILSALIAAPFVLDNEGTGSLNLQEGVGCSTTTPPSPSLFKVETGHRLLAAGVEIDHHCRHDGTGHWSTIVAQSVLASRFCYCEKQTRVVNRILRCHLCEHTACSSCAGNPEHAYEPKVIVGQRIQPLDFQRMLRRTLPMRLRFAVPVAEVLGLLRRDRFLSLSDATYDDTWEQYVSSVKNALREEVRFTDITRTEIWTVFFEGESVSLRLEIDKDGFQWLLFAKPPSRSPAQCVLREILAKPIARMRPESPEWLFQGVWEVLDPISTEFTLQVSGLGNQVPTYLSSCGLLGPRHAEPRIWTHLKIDCKQSDADQLDRDLRGTYQHLPDCGTAEGSLYKKDCPEGQPPVYLFFDPRKAGRITHDGFVFSVEHRRNPGYGVRRTIAELPPSWRPVSVLKTHQNISAYSRRFHRVPSFSLSTSGGQPITYHHLDAENELILRGEDCRATYIPLVSLSADAATLGLSERRLSWTSTNPEKDPNAFRGIAWALQRAGDAFSSYNKWMSLRLPGMNGICSTCKPTQPSFIWRVGQKGKVFPCEDPREAATWARAVKSKPPLFLIFENVDDSGMGELQISANLQSMAHSAHGQLFGIDRLNGLNFEWRLIPNAYDMGRQKHALFEIPDNQNDAMIHQPPNFQTLQLRNEQLRSLGWMVAQEADNIEPFMEEETVEAPLPMMAWRADVKASIPRTVRGGLIADEVGFGKTAIILGLIDSQYERDKARTLSSVEKLSHDGLLTTKATLIVVPNNVCKQWHNEINKFFGNGGGRAQRRYKVMVISTIKQLGSITFEDIQKADIVLVSWNVLNSQIYYQKLQLFVGAAQIPNAGKGGRAFDHWLEAAFTSLGDMVGLLSNGGPSSYLDEAATRHGKNEANLHWKPSKRLRGKAFQEANKAKNQVLLESDEDVDDEELDDTPVAGPSKEGQDIDDAVKKAKDTAINEIRNTFMVPDDSKGFWKMKHPLLHAFHFNRLVIDEYTYVGEDKHLSMQELSARSKWILSGTPAIRDFADIKSIARYLGLHLGVDDDMDVPSNNERLKLTKRNQTSVEKFMAYQVPHSNDWYQNRYRHAQHFLDRFARQNFAEIGNIPAQVHATLSTQFENERSSYIGLRDRLQSEGGRIRRIQKSEKDPQVDRWNDILSSSRSLAEVLLKASVTSKLNDHAWTQAKCATRLKALEKTELDRENKLRVLIRQFYFLKLRKDPHHSVWDEFVEKLLENPLGDDAITDKITIMISEGWENNFAPGPVEAACTTRLNKATKQVEVKPRKKSTIVLVTVGESVGVTPDATLNESPDEAVDETINDDTEIPSDDDDDAVETPSGSSKRTKSQKQSLPLKRARGQPEASGSKDPDDKASKIEDAMATALQKDFLDAIRNIVKCKRDIRFNETMIFMQSEEVPECSSCHCTPDSAYFLSVLQSCGHIFCSTCMEKTVSFGRCSIEGCNASAANSKWVRGQELDSSTIISESSKLMRFIELIREIPDDEQVIAFAQYAEIITLLERALELARISHRVARNASVKGILDFVNDPKPASSRGNGKGKGRATSKEQEETELEQDEQGALISKRPKVLVLPLGGAMAAGLNLQCANHIVFVSPLHTMSQHEYDAGMKQAIGRARRYGQNKTVNIYHMLVENTAEINVVEERRKETLVRRFGWPLLLAESDERFESDERLAGEDIEFYADDDINDIDDI
ncbi:C-5 cytosine methyltransferase [Penicillium verhagenii]|uniref:C-5 cytosine methyltransferase n=1 Tax=Penicillium verhagenii TaxID=1562060 RepID=UPI0025458864|nr:C-5 cytosine methyltransferase [Penicillium verhagenii]KAJ5921180.1 C-5 cytosine methyltransferase [Penicillium verhagenii]